MKTNFLKLFQNTLSLLMFLACIIFNVRAQTPVSSINIGSAQQTLNPGTFNPWRITALAPGIQTALCFTTNNNNYTAGPPPPATPPTGATTAALAVNQNAIALTSPPFVPQPPQWPNGTYLSCFNGNTIYTLRPTAGQGNSTNTAMTIRRQFIVCNNLNTQVQINLSVVCDDYLNGVILDAGTPNAQTLFATATPSLANPIQITAVRTLAPGLHWIDVQCGDWEEPTTGSYYTINGVSYQWNPFGVRIIGSVSSVSGNTILLNEPAAAVNPITGPSTVCISNTITLSNATANGVWASSNPAVASITQAGVVTGVSVGNVSISYTVGQGSCASIATYNVEVKDCHCEDPCSWGLTGNTVVNSWNFIGSINNADFNIRTNNTQRMVVTAAGNVGIGTTTPARLLDVQGKARIFDMDDFVPGDALVARNAAGDLHKMAFPNNPQQQYLGGDGAWHDLSVVGGGGITDAANGLTSDGVTVSLGDKCGGETGKFKESRQVNMDNQNLYFNSSKIGKLYMGNTGGVDGCRDLFSRLEISSEGLRAGNGYDLRIPSTSGLRFTNLTAREAPIESRFEGVLSLDEEGDVIWVKTCCARGKEVKEDQLKDIYDRLTKLENELKASKEESALLKGQLQQMDVLLSDKNMIVLNQNVPNPFLETTTITYAIPKKFSSARIIFTGMSGEVIRTAEIKQPGKGQVNVYAKDISAGLYSYTLIVDGKSIETKKMIKQ